MWRSSRREPPYEIQFDSDARNVALMLPADPQLGREAFPELDRPEILSVRHTLMNIRTPKQP